MEYLGHDSDNKFDAGKMAEIVVKAVEQSMEKIFSRLQVSWEEANWKRVTRISIGNDLSKMSYYLDYKTPGQVHLMDLEIGYEGITISSEWLKPPKHSVESQYQAFLSRMALEESKMPNIQKEQLRQTFYGAWGQCLLYLRDEVGSLPEEEGINAMAGMLEEVSNFFLSSVHKKDN